MSTARQLQYLLCTLCNAVEMHRANRCMECERAGRIAPPAAPVAPPASPYGRSHYKPERKRGGLRGRPSNYTLTAREIQVIELLAKGMQSIDIARTLNVSRSFVSNTIATASGRLGLTGLAELSAYARTEFRGVSP